MARPGVPQPGAPFGRMLTAMITPMTADGALDGMVILLLSLWLAIAARRRRQARR